MEVLAFIFIGLGLAGLLYIVMSASVEKKQEATAPRIPSERHPGTFEHQREPEKHAPISANRPDRAELLSSPRTQSVRLQFNEPAMPVQEHLVVNGVLFLDHGRHVPIRAGSTSLPPRMFAEMRRAGEAVLSIQGSQFLIQCQGASYGSSSAELEQIIFQEGGVAFVSVLPERPVLVFLTSESERVKAFIKKHASVRTAQ